MYGKAASKVFARNSVRKFKVQFFGCSVLSYLLFMTACQAITVEDKIGCSCGHLYADDLLIEELMEYLEKDLHTERNLELKGIKFGKD